MGSGAGNWEAEVGLSERDVHPECLNRALQQSLPCLQTLCSTTCGTGIDITSRSHITSSTQRRDEGRELVLLLLNLHTFLPTFSVKGQIVNILGFSGPIVSVTSIQLCCCSVTAARDDIHTVSVAVTIKLY